MDLVKFLNEYAAKSANYPQLELKAAADEIIALRSKLDSLRQNLAVAHDILNDAMAEQDYHVDVSRTAVWLAANERVVERPVTICGEMFPPGQFSVQQCTLPKGHAGEHANNVKGL